MRIHLALEGDFKGHDWTRSACGQTRGFYSEAEDCDCVGPQQGHEITCRKCKRIYMRRIMNGQVQKGTV